MVDFSTDATNLVDRELHNIKNIRPECLDPGFDCYPELVAITCELRLEGSDGAKGSGVLTPLANIKAWKRAETGKIKLILPSEMPQPLATAIVTFAGDHNWSDTPYQDYVVRHSDSSESLYYEACFMRDITVVGWANPQDGMTDIDGEDIEGSHSYLTKFLGCIYATEVQSNHQRIVQNDKICRDVRNHHRLIKQLTDVSFELRELRPPQK